MTNFSLTFLNSPWFLLLIPVAFLLTFIPYFRLAKRYRRTRNRIISIVMHLILSVLTVSVLSGLQFHYETPNNNNELIVLIDGSYSTENLSKSRDELVDELIKDSEKYNCKVGLVIFGFDQEIICRPTGDINKLREEYKKFTEDPSSVEYDSDATDIAAAFKTAGDMLSSYGSSKVVLVSDGKETDESALSYIRNLTAKGVKIDVLKPTAEEQYGTSAEVQICDVTFPDSEVALGLETTINVKVKSTVSTPVSFVFYDNRKSDSKPVIEEIKRVNEGEQEFTFKYTFKEGVFHQIDVTLDTGKQVTEQTLVNNEFTTYLTIEVFDSILIVENFQDDSKTLEALLAGTEDENLKALVDDAFKYNVTRVKIGTPEFNEAREKLSTFDQVIFNNVANKDLPEGFIDEVRDFVYEQGGGLFTIGGNDSSGKVHVYDREDLGTASAKTYQDMLPISAVNYTPPMGVAFIVDVSGSMSGDPLYKAKAGLELAVRYGLSERDYVSIFTLDTIYGQVLPLTPVSNMDTIVNAIQSIGGTGGTVATNAITRAAQSLNANNNIARKHIIMLTDGIFGDKCEEGEDPPYVKEARLHYTNSGITLSVVGIGMDVGSTYYNSCKQMTDAAGGKTYAGINLDNLGNILKDDIQQDEITAVTEGAFRPVVSRITDPLLKGIKLGDDESSKNMDFALGAFYGGKIKQNATLVLTDRYNAPVYAYWSYGRGKVGSLMCDLKGTSGSYSAPSYTIEERKKTDSGQYQVVKTEYNGIYASENGQKLIYGIVRELMPETRLIAGELDLRITEENYINSLNLYTMLEDGDTLDAFITKENDSTFEKVSLMSAGENVDGVYVITPFSKANLFSRCSFVVNKSGVYRVTVTVTRKDGVKKTTELFKTFSYSKEYDMFPDSQVETTANSLLDTIAARGDGVVISTIKRLNYVFVNFEPTIKHDYDPRILFLIISIIALLIDVAVRKFKFKWLHEIIREKRKEKEEQ